MSRLVTRDPIDVARLTMEISDAGRGGTVVFLGSVRRSAEDGPVTEIEYAGYEEMLSRELAQILDEAHARWPNAACAAQHRLGVVPVGEPSIAILAAAPHRAAAFDACRFIIEAAKRRLPVWKHEHFENGTSQWREA
jgi:molybdopterin synthase catalytic subunit